MATHSSILAWEISWIEEPAAAAKSLQSCSGLQSVGSQSCVTEHTTQQQGHKQRNATRRGRGWLGKRKLCQGCVMWTSHHQDSGNVSQKSRSWTGQPSSTQEQTCQSREQSVAAEQTGHERHLSNPRPYRTASSHQPTSPQMILKTQTFTFSELQQHRGKLSAKGESGPSKG